MAAAPPQLSISPNINPISGTGSDIHGSEFDFSFGEINVGNEGGNDSFMEKIVRDAVTAITVALAVKFFMGWKK
jgi:hypothetical protein